MNTRLLVNFQGLSAELGLPVRTLRSLYHAKKIPALVLGHRTIRFSPERVRAALDKFERKAVA
jgi:hypothetical protein